MENNDTTLELEYEITTCCPNCGATFKAKTSWITCINCSNEFKTRENEILIGDETELDQPK